jgi:hypothetical protein
MIHGYLFSVIFIISPESFNARLCHMVAVIAVVGITPIVAIIAIIILSSSPTAKIPMISLLMVPHRGHCLFIQMPSFGLGGWHLVWLINGNAGCPCTIQQIVLLLAVQVLHVLPLLGILGLVLVAGAAPRT